MTPDYHIRKADADDVPALVHHRQAMFTDMGMRYDRAELERAFVPWLRDALARKLYHGWVAEAPGGEVVGGAGLTVLPWPPAPRNLVGRIAFVYNVYTEPPHRRRGLARRMMDVIHAWSRDHGIVLVALHASDDGRPLYESMGYEPTNEMRLLLRK